MAEVDAFLELARKQYDNPSQQLLTSLDVRAVRFKLVKNGYSISVVDSALEKLEDAFASNEYSNTVKSMGFFDFQEDLGALRA